MNPCAFLKTEEPPSRTPSGSPPPLNESIKAELPPQQTTTPVAIADGPETMQNNECDEAFSWNQETLSTPMHPERPHSQPPQRRIFMFETTFDNTCSEFKFYERVRSDLDEIVQSLNREICSLRRQISDLWAENHHKEVEIRQTRMLLQEAQRQAQQAVEWHINSKSRANGHKLPEIEFRSKWKQLKFNVKMLSGHIFDNDPADSLEARYFTKVMNTFKTGKRNDANKSFFQELYNRRLGLEAYLWKFLCDVVFDSKSRTDAAGTRSAFKELRKQYARLNTGNSSQITALYNWLQSGWPITKPSSPESVNELLRKDCEEICEMVCGNDGIERSNSRAESREELRDILSLALELDDMIMTSKAMLTVVWPVEVPELNAGNGTEYRESHMEAVREDGEPSENVKLQFCVTPILLKKGNASGRNYESQIVLVKGDVVVSYESCERSTGLTQPQENTIP